MESGIPRTSCPFDSSTLVTGSAMGVGLKHAGAEEDAARGSRQVRNKDASISPEKAGRLHDERMEEVQVAIAERSRCGRVVIRCCEWSGSPGGFEQV